MWPFLNSLLEKWVWESGPKIDAATGVMAVGASIHYSTNWNRHHVHPYCNSFKNATKRPFLTSVYSKSQDWVTAHSLSLSCLPTAFLSLTLSLLLFLSCAPAQKTVEFAMGHEHCLLTWMCQSSRCDVVRHLLSRSRCIHELGRPRKCLHKSTVTVT